MFDITDPDIRFAIDAVNRAEKVIQYFRGRMGSVSPIIKSDLSPVTIADFAVQAVVGQMLGNVFPHDMLIGEEDSCNLKSVDGREKLNIVTQFLKHFFPEATPEYICQWIDRGSTRFAQRYWALDPIDGTKGFLRGDQFSIALGLVVNGRVQVGVLCCPNLLLQGHKGVFLVASRGDGAWISPINDRNCFSQIRVSSQDDSTQARLLCSFESEHTDISKTKAFSENMNIGSPIIRMDSQAKYSVLAGGEGEIYLRFVAPNRKKNKEKVWDHAAGSILVEEAGGCVTDLDGKLLDFSKGRRLEDNQGICATNGILHNEALNLIQKMI